MKRNISLALSLICIILFVLGCGGKEEYPEEAIKTYKSYVVNDEWDKVWDMMPRANHEIWDKKILQPTKEGLKQAPPDMQKEIAAQLKSDPEEIQGMDAKTYFIRIMGGPVSSGSAANFGVDVDKKIIKGKSATVTLKNEPTEYFLIKEDGIWKIDICKTMKMGVN